MIMRKYALTAIASVLAMGTPGLTAKDADECTHRGKVVSFNDGKLVMTDKDGKEHEHTLARDAEVCLDGKVIKAEDLKAGSKIRVTTREDAKDVAIRIEALDKLEDYENMYVGKVVSMTDGVLVMKGKDGKECTQTLAQNAKVSLDGKDGSGEDVKAGMRIRVTFAADGKRVVNKVEALDKQEDFDKGT
jgi:hypothetical protein